MALRAALFLMVGGLLFAGSDKSAAAQKAKCIADCKAKCTRSYDTCKKNATTKTAIEGCQKSLNLCSANCSNKACG